MPNFPPPLPHTSLHFTLTSGVLFDKNLRRSVAWKKTQREVATLISGSYPADVVAKWHKMRDAYDNDPNMPNPYEEAEDCAVSFTYYLTARSLNSQVSPWPT